MILLFDLAGVLLNFQGIESIWSMSGGAISSKEFGEFWSKSSVADRLYRGEISPDQFASEAIEELSLTVGPEQFLDSFRHWLVGPYEGAFELLERLKRDHTLACLSNTNVLDCDRFRRELRLHERFHFCFFSNELGLRKPDIECYQLVLRKLSAHSTEVIFFDDNLECVEGAHAAGLGAYQCAGIVPLTEKLANLGLI